MKKLIKTYLNTETAFIIAVAIFEIFHVQRLFGGAELLTGGDNYIFLQLGKINLYPYMWDLKFTSFGGINVSLPNLLGIPFYSYFLKYLPFPLYYFLKLYLSNKFDFSNIFKLIILSIIFSPINSNIALGVTIFIPQIL